MAQRVRYPDHIEPLVEFVEETSPERIVAATHDKLAAGTPVKEMLLASALAVVRSSDLPPGHHGGPLHPLCGLHAVHHISARLPGEYAMLPVIQNVAVANKHITRRRWDRTRWPTRVPDPRTTMWTRRSRRSGPRGAAG